VSEVTEGKYVLEQREQLKEEVDRLRSLIEARATPDVAGSCYVSKDGEYHPLLVYWWQDGFDDADEWRKVYLRPKDEEE
jgi:hypothetical protein